MIRPLAGEVLQGAEWPALPQMSFGSPLLDNLEGEAPTASAERLAIDISDEECGPPIFQLTRRVATGRLIGCICFSESGVLRKRDPRRPRFGSGPRRLLSNLPSDELISSFVRRGQPRRHPLLMTLAARVVDAKIVLGVLIEIFSGNAIVAGRRFAGESEVALKYLIGVAADLDGRAVAVECLIVLRGSRLLF